MSGPSEPATPHEPGPAQQSGADPRSAERRPRLRPEWLVVWATVGILAATGGNIWVSLQQWAFLRAQLNAVRDANTQQMKTVTDAAKGTDVALEISRRHVAALENQAVVLNRQVAALETAGAARLGVSRVVSMLGRDEIKIGIPIDNYGRISSPTMKVKVLTSTFADLKEPEREVHMFGGDRTHIPPGSGGSGVTVLVPLVPGDAERLEARTLQMMIAGTLDWDTGFGKRASGRFCFSYAPQAHWETCRAGDYEMLAKLVSPRPVASEERK